MTRVLITGAASGLGKELALNYAKQGAKICVADIHQERAEATVSETSSLGAEAFFQTLDVRSTENFNQARDEILKRWSGIDIVINNAGVASAGRFDAIELDTWEWLLSINLMGVIRGCKTFTPVFKQQRSGHFVNIASMAGLLNPPGMADYNVAKAGVIALSETLRAELAPWNIHTTVVCPSFFKTNLGESLRSTDAHFGDAFRKLLEKSELSASDIAEIIVTAVAQGEFLVLPHDDARLAYQLKCADPEQAFQQTLKIAHSNYQKLLDNEERGQS